MRPLPYSLFWCYELWKKAEMGLGEGVLMAILTPCLVTGQPPIARGTHTLKAETRVLSHRQVYWVKTAPPRDEEPNPGCKVGTGPCWEGFLGYFGSDVPGSLIVRVVPGSNAGHFRLEPNCWQSIWQAKTPSEPLTGTLVQLEFP